ncbi:MAG: IS1634 family transposase, partial [Erysipelotrichaceae bacterium]
ILIMKLNFSRSKNSCTLYVQKSYRDKDGRSTTKTIECLGSLDDIKAKHGCADPLEWAQAYVRELTLQEKLGKRKVKVEYAPSKLLEKEGRRSFNGGYLFIQHLYNQLGLPNICEEISSRHKFEYDLNEILSRLIYTRILYPGSKASSFQDSGRFIEQPKFKLENIYRSLSVLSSEADYIQAQLFKNSKEVINRKTGVIFYDCTNYFFEIEQADKNSGLRQYGYSKEHRPNPIVQMGMFMDASGLPLAFCINPGNKSEQQTLIPLEETLNQKFGLSEFVVCTDGGLSSIENRKYNSKGNRGFITVQSLKDNKIASHIQAWALSKDGWKVKGDNQEYTIDTPESHLKDSDGNEITLYKERWINEKGLEQRIIVTFSYKYRTYGRTIRAEQIQRANNTINNGTALNKKKSPNDAQRFVKIGCWSDDGTEATKKTASLDQEIIDKEERFDGFYAICTNLEDNATEIIKVNSWRWEIEDFFRILKTEFEARPVYLRREDRIIAHFITCFISLL